MKRSLFLLPLLALTLTSCDTMSDAWNGTTNGVSSAWDSAFGPDEKPVGMLNSGCPQVAAVRDLSIYQNPPVADENTLVITARMGNVRGGCSTNPGGVSVDAMVDIVALKGRNSASTHASLPFFVSVLDPHDEVISKKIYEVPVDFENGAQETRISSPIQPQFDLKPGEDGSAYRVLIGFHLNSAQVDANTRFFGGTPMAVK